MSDKVLNILAISGSLRAISSNTAVLRAMAKMADKNIRLNIYDGLGTLPHFSPEIDGDLSAPSVVEFRKLIYEADGIILCTPEYAFGVPGVLKNALDWTVSTGDFTKKPLAVISASPSFLGGDKAHASLLLTMTALDAIISEETKLMIPAIKKKQDEHGEITDVDTLDKLKSVLDALIKNIQGN